MIKELDEFNFHSIIPETSGLALVFFSGPHCASCHHLRDLLIAQKQVFVSAFVEFNCFEVKADKATALVNEFNVFHLPSMFLYQDGTFHCELQSQAHSQKLIEAIELALSEPAEEEP
ncbi:MAG: thioredoxin family protein [Cocleimonas sp.]